MEVLAKPGVGGIIEKTFNGVHHILLQGRYKDDAPLEVGLIEIPAGKVRAFESVFACSQNLIGDYPIMVQTFICKAQGEVVEQTDETQNVRWVPVETLREMLRNSERNFYPMHIAALRKYVTYIESRM